jgi:uncharacterized protein YbjT (DUF2867 family)
MPSQTAVVLGATGLIGSHVLEALLNDDSFTTVKALVRRPLTFTHPKLQILITDFSNFKNYQDNIGKGDCIFCCIGTTNAQVKGDKRLYRTIDFDIPVNAARFGKEAGYRQFLLVSAVGANSKSRIFYSRLKGEVEEVIDSFQFKSFHVFQPSFLLGKRKEQRTGEYFFKTILKGLAFITPAKYKPVEAAAVAKAMLKAAKEAKEGKHVYTYAEIISC